MAKKDKDPIQEFNQQAEKVKKKIPNNRVKIADPDDREPLSEEERSGKKTKEPEQSEEQPKERPKNQLVEIPNRVEVAFDGSKPEEDLEVDDPAHHLVEQIESGELAPEDLNSDQKMMAIAFLSEKKHLTGDECAAKMKMSRRSIVKYLRAMRDFRARQLAEKDLWDLGGEIYTMGLEAMRIALLQQKPQQWSYAASTTISLLQSMGLVFKMPERTQSQQQITKDIQVKGSQGLSDMQKAMQGEEVNVQKVLDEMLSAAKSGQLEKGSEEKGGKKDGDS